MNSQELLSALIRLSKADNYFDEFEFAYLIKVGKHIGMQDTDVEQMIKNEELILLNIPKAEEERMSIIYYMLFLMPPPISPPTFLVKRRTIGCNFCPIFSTWF